MKYKSNIFQCILTLLSIFLLSGSFYIMAKSKSTGLPVTKEGEIGIVQTDGYGEAQFIALACKEEDDWVYYYIKKQGKGMDLFDRDGEYLKVQGDLTIDNEDRKWLLVQSWKYVDRPEDDNSFTEYDEIIDQEGIEFENSENYDIDSNVYDNTTGSETE